ncbi:MAG: hydroxylamine reductase [Rhodothermaceae bacterium]
MSMFCYQCQEAAKGTGCEGNFGVCGISADVSNLRELSMYVVKGLAYYSVKAREMGIEIKEGNTYFVETLFTAVTNVSFDEADFKKNVQKGIDLRKEYITAIEAAGGKMDENLPDCATWTPGSDEAINAKANEVETFKASDNEDVRSLRDLILFGLKGMAAYLDHANVLGYDSEECNVFVQKALKELTNDELTVDETIALVMETGKYGVDVMALLDKANTETYGNPEITEVNIGVGTNPGILISGHDLKDMQQLLEQTEGTGVDVYTHSEMLPAHYYPAFKKYSHFVGNYGNAWWKQGEEFTKFNGPIVMTTNCITPVKDAYQERIFTTGLVGYPGLKSVKVKEDGTKDFSEVIELAKKCEAPTEIETGKIVGGFAHNQVMAVADKVVEAVKSGAIKKFVVMAGCDGRQKGRSYFTDLAQELPQEAVILTAGCAKYRYNKLELGDIGGIPRVLDAGQCNDSYSLAVIALKLKEAFGLEDINDLPLAFDIAWYEQKAVIVLLALLFLGVKGIRLGPTLPAFLSPNVAKVLVENFDIKAIGDVKADVAEIMGQA